MGLGKQGHVEFKPDASKLKGEGTIANCNPSDYATTYFVGKTPLPEGAVGPAYKGDDDDDD
jgi:hypothetical protein